MTTVTQRNRGIGWRLKCQNCNLKMEPTNNTFLRRVRINSELGCDVIVKMAYMWLRRRPLVDIQEECGVASDTAVAWNSYFRDVAMKVAWHDFLPIGGATDVVEVDETHLLKAKYNVGRPTIWRNIYVF